MWGSNTLWGVVYNLSKTAATMYCTISGPNINYLNIVETEKARWGFFVNIVCQQKYFEERIWIRPNKRRTNVDHRKHSIPGRHPPPLCTPWLPPPPSSPLCTPRFPPPPSSNTQRSQYPPGTNTQGKISADCRQQISLSPIRCLVTEAEGPSETVRPKWRSVL